MKKVLVTGASGFIGSALVEELIRHDIEVIAVVRNSDSNFDVVSNKITRIDCELSGISNLPNTITGRDVDVFYHLAWAGSSGDSRADYDLQLRNVAYLCDAAIVAKTMGCGKFVATGSISENIAKSFPANQTPVTTMHYGVAKNTAAAMLDITCQNIKIPYVWAQLSNVYGLNNQTSNIMSYALSNLFQGRRAQFGSGTQYYDLVSVYDVASALYLLGAHANSKNSYFIGSGEPRPLKEYLLEIGKAMGDESLIGIGERPDDGLRFSENWFDISDLKNDTGFSTSASFEDNIRGIIQSYMPDVKSE